MRSFKDYENRRTGESETASAEELTKKIAAAYNGKSNADMLRGILAEAEKSRRAGTLSDADIDRFYQTFSPMLDSAQKKRLRAVVEKLKNT